MEPYFLFLVGVSRDSAPPPKKKERKNMPMYRSHPPALPGTQRLCPDGSGGTQSGEGTRAHGAEGRSVPPRLTPGVSGPRDRRSTRPAPPTRAWRPVRPGELRGAGSRGPGRPRAARGEKPEKPSLGVEVIKLLIRCRGSERASGRLGRSFERVYLRTLQEERARNSRISSEAANICKREKEAEPGRAAASLPPEPRRRPGRTRPHS